MKPTGREYNALTTFLLYLPISHRMPALFHILYCIHMLQLVTLPLVPAIPWNLPWLLQETVYWLQIPVWDSRFDLSIELTLVFFWLWLVLPIVMIGAVAALINQVCIITLLIQRPRM